MAPDNRRFLRDRADPGSPFRVLRNHRKGLIPEQPSAHKGQVYVARCDGLKSGVYKIGKSTDYFSRRSQALSHPTGVPGFYFPVYRLETDLFDQLEKDVLHSLQPMRLHRRKEFVECPLDDIVKILRQMQRESAPELAFAEHFYFPIDAFEALIEGMYHDFLQRPGPNQWPLMCVFLSLLSGMPPTEVLIRVGQQRETLPPLLGGMLDADDVQWMIAYMRSQLRFGYIPLADDLEDESLEWSLMWLEELLWDAISATAFLRKIHACTDLPSTESFCLMLHQKACAYWGARPCQEHPEVAAALERMRHRLDFHFI